MAGFEFLLAGRTLADRYRLDAVIGRGGMGAVFRASDLRLERPVAVKVVAGHEDEGRLRARFRREAQSAARIRHPNVVTVFDFGTDPELGLDFLVMELLEGEDLGRHVPRHGALPLALGLLVLRDTAQGLAAGHRLGLVHRDVKPANVFLAGPGDPPRTVLLDFGIAKIHTEAEDTHTALTRLGGAAPHSPGFAAPEQLRGDAQLTPACDVFSLAATAYYALSGERAYTPQQLQALALGEPVALVPPAQRVPELPIEVQEALTASLDPDPSRRPANADAFLALLSGVPLPPPTAVPIPAPPTDGAPTAESPPAAVSVAPARKGVSLPWLWPLLTIAIAAAAVGAVLSLQDAPPPPAPASTTMDSAAIADSIGRVAARADSMLRAQVQRDSAERARADSVALAAAAPVDTVPADSVPEPLDPRNTGVTYDVSALTRRPVMRNSREMERVAARFYPPLLRETRVEGRAVVSLILGENGRPVQGSIRVTETDHPLFGEAALRIAEHLRFSPAEVDGRRVRVATTLPIDFRID